MKAHTGVRIYSAWSYKKMYISKKILYIILILINIHFIKKIIEFLIFIIKFINQYNHVFDLID